MEHSIKAIIVEDDPYSLLYLKTLLNKSSNLEVSNTFYNGKDFLKHLYSGYEYDVAFLDIALPDINGNDIGRVIRERSPNAQIVFVTGNTGYAAQAFDLEASDYLVKPFDPERLERCLKRIVSRMKSLNLQTKPYILRKKNKTICLNISEIIFIEKYKKRVLIHTTKEIYDSGDNLGIIEKHLLPEGFVRSHKSFLINPRFIKSIEKWGDRVYQICFNGTEKKALLSRAGSKKFKLI